jgi:transcriptional regulator with XRE-family HTH domain
MEEEGVTLRQAAERLGVSHSLFVKWRQQRAADVDPILAMLKSKKKAASAGPLGQLKPLEQALLRHIFEHREQGMTVHTFDLVVKASSLSPEFNAKHFLARCSAVKRFMRAGTTSPPTRRDVATWVDRAMAEMKSQVGIIRNAWLKTDYEWFPKEGREEGNIIGGKEGTDSGHN